MTANNTKELIWQPIKSAPRDGTGIYGRKHSDKRRRLTWWGKVSHVPLYGWCIGGDVENVDLWEPDEWSERHVG